MFNARLSAGLMHAAQLLGMLRAPESEDIPLQFPPPRGGMPSVEPPVLPPVPSSWLAAPPASSAGARQAGQLAGRLEPKIVPAIKDKEEEPPTPTEGEEKPPAPTEGENAPSSPAKASRPLKGGQTIAEQIRERVHKARDSLKADRAQACRGMHD
jgi:hypothetical protein